MKHLFLLAVLPVVLMGWTSCTHSGKGHTALPDPRAVDKSVPEYKNPFHPSTYAHFVARKDYRKTYDVYKDDTLLNRKPKKSRKIFVCLDEQRGQYLVDGLIAMDFPLSSGVKAYPTKTGDYTVISKRKTTPPTFTARCMMRKANASTITPNPRTPFRREAALTVPPCPTGSGLPMRAWGCMWGRYGATPSPMAACACRGTLRKFSTSKPA